MVGGSLGLWGERMQFWAGGEFGVVGGRTQFWAGASLCKRDHIPVN